MQGKLILWNTHNAYLHYFTEFSAIGALRDNNKQYFAFCWSRRVFILKMRTPRPLFVYFHYFQQQFLQKIFRLRTQIVGVEGKHADLLTTTTTIVVALCETNEMINKLNVLLLLQ